MSESPGADQRSKRRKIDKHGRFAALEKLKNMKASGVKHKYEVDEIKNVYDEVDESEYARIVNERAREDFVDDDDGDGYGYVENGREVFDEDELEEGPSRVKEKSGKKGKKRAREEPEERATGRKSLKNYFNKERESKVKIADDDILADILGEIKSESTASGSGFETKQIRPMKMVAPKPKPVDKDEEMRKYMENFSKNIKKTEKVEERDSDEEMLDRVLKQSTVENRTKAKAKPVAVPATVPKPVVKEEPEVKQEATISEADLSHLETDFLDDDFDIPQTGVETQPTQKCPMSQVNAGSPKGKVVKTDSEKLLSGWENICLDELEEEMVADMDTSVTEESTETIRFWFWDAWTDPAKCLGEIYIFGKMATKKPGEFQSVCIHVLNVDRAMYLLPREKELDSDEPVTMLSVYNEFRDDISTRLKVTNYKTKKVKKNFAYTSGMSDLQVPTQSDYLEVRYSAKLPAPALDRKYRTIAHIFGTNTNIVEQFLLERKIKGPCWMEFKNFKKNPAPSSHCKQEFTVPDIGCITVAQQTATTSPPPPLVVCAINVRSILNKGTNEIAMISMLTHDRFPLNRAAPNPPFNKAFCGVARPSGTSWPYDFNPAEKKRTKVTKCENERTLLNWFLSMYGNIDPDLIVTHDAYDFQLDLICQRLMAMKIPQWARVSRLKMKTPSTRRVDDFFVGRLICDVKTSAEELIKSRSYDLNTLCTEVLKIDDGERKDVLLEDIPTMFEKSSDLGQLIDLTMQDNFFTMRLLCEMNVLPLALQITQIAGNLMNRTLHGGRAERNEFLLLHAFNEKDFILPDKPAKFQDGGNPSEPTERRKPKSKAAYSGGLVLDPIKGFYDKFILLMDFNSLYPSIIQEYNICFTTVPPPTPNEAGDDESSPPTIIQTEEMGILPRQVRKLVESRRAVKQLMKASGLEPEQMAQYNIRQMALKLTANSLYGCLGYTRSRFYAQHMAALITLKGREILMNTKSIVEKMDYQVIYGDTDSIMINTNIVDYEQVNKIGTSIKQLVNRTYKCLELDVDGIYKYLLLLKKKKYAAVSISKVGTEYKCTQELKGLDIVRRDWSKIAVIAGNFVLAEILSDKPMDERIENIHGKLEKLKADLLGGATFLSLLEITKQLTRSLNEYSDASQLPHVTVAIRMNKTRNRNFKRGDMVGYIICDDGTSAAAMKRAYHIDELKDPANADKLKPDVDYYLSQQVFPVVFRICEPLEGTDACRLALALGLDPKKFQALGAAREGDRDHAEGEAVQKTIAQKYRMCHRFDFKCVACGTNNPVAAGFRKDGGKQKSVFERCANEKCDVRPHHYLPAIKNQLTLAIRGDIKRFYQRWMVCDNPVCNANTRLSSQVASKNNPICLHCLKGLLVQQYSESDLYLQLNYYSYIFDLSHYSNKFTRVLPVEIREAHDKLKDIVRQFLVQSKYATVKMSTLYAKYAFNDASGQKVHAVKAFAEAAAEARVKKEPTGAVTASKKKVPFPFGKYLNRK